MQDQAVEWDVRAMLCGTSTADQVLVFSLLAVLIIVCFKLVRVWKTVKPFSQRLPENRGDYANLLQLTIRSLTQWIQFSFLFGGLCIWIIVAKIFERWVLAPKQGHILDWCSFQEVSGGVGLVLAVASVEFLARWHSEKRLEKMMSN